METSLIKLFVPDYILAHFEYECVEKIIGVIRIYLVETRDPEHYPKEPLLFLICSLKVILADFKSAITMFRITNHEHQVCNEDVIVSMKNIAMQHVGHLRCA